MPHLCIEYTANTARDADWMPLLCRLHEVTAATIGTDIGNCKSRVMRRELFLVGSGGDEGGFVHVDVQILEGRSAAARSALSNNLLAVLREALHADLPRLQITVQVRDIERATYAKHPDGTLTPVTRMA